MADCRKWSARTQEDHLMIIKPQQVKPLVRNRETTAVGTPRTRTTNSQGRETTPVSVVES